MDDRENYSSVTVRPSEWLDGDVTIPGDKVSAVHLSLASALSMNDTLIRNMHPCGDVLRIHDWLAVNGLAQVNPSSEGYRVSTRINNGTVTEVDLSSIADTRSNICLATPLALGGAAVKFVGTAGCGFTKRGVDKHFELMRAFGVEVEQRRGHFEISGTPLSRSVDFDCATASGIPSVGATCHALMAGMVYPGEINLTNAATEAAPSKLLEYISEVTGRTVHREGRAITLRAMGSVEHREVDIALSPDITVGSTYIGTATSAGGSLKLNGMSINNLPTSMLKIYREAGLDIESDNGNLHVYADKNTLALPRAITCDVWPAFPSDSAPIMAASIAGLEGEAIVRDLIYDQRLTHVPGLNAMGYAMEARGNATVIRGGVPRRLGDVAVSALDIRAGAALIVGTLGSNARSVRVEQYNQIYRGYADLIQGLQGVGADINPER